MDGKTILVTGSPGFIGANLVIRLLGRVHCGHIISLDNMNDYYDPALKEYRLKCIEEAAKTSAAQHTFIRGDLSDKALVSKVFSKYHPAVVVNLAAQAGVRYSVEHPDVYIDSNITGFFNILEACRHESALEHLVFASSSSVYGDRSSIPFSTEDKCDSPVSLYAATKKCDELLAYCYSRLYRIPSTGLRFFTVYGPAGRPDMFYYNAICSLLSGGDVSVYNYGNCKRDFTYVDDVTEGIYRVMQGAPEADQEPPYSVYNIGKGSPEELKAFISAIEDELVAQGLLPEDFDFEAHKKYIEMQPGDVEITYADTSGLENDFSYRPETDVRTGIHNFVQWFRGYYQV